MSNISIMPSDIHEIASEFRKGSDDSAKVVRNLEKAMSHLQSKWDGSSEQLFFRDYKLWRDQARGFVGMLSNIALELDAMAERFADADK
jgi:WXG100 family type VII secretion target